MDARGLKPFEARHRRLRMDSHYGAMTPDRFF
ncbi:protein of unknown function [Azospirillum baldaniorum]|uniref:Uncharacterized protein n=1 Tax=Azospirillum baldaniorum TaxID=1064539 RepID=A0A9P1JRF3_9PROT|nr:protein of unknown function [Azospirillum baldaniorum]